jgi:hypothetical protein
MYKEWADGQINKIKGILNSARADHTEAVKTRIESVQQLGSVVNITKTLFEVSKVLGRHRGGLIATANMFTGNRSTRSQSFRTRAKHCPCCRSQNRS